MRKISIISLTIMFLCSAFAFAAPSPPAEIRGDLSRFDGSAGIYAVNLKTGRSFTYNENMIFPTASTSKLIVTLAVYKYLYNTASQDKKSLYETDVSAMIKVSDNDSFYELLDELAANRPAGLKSVIADLGLKKTFIHDDEAYKRYNYHSVTTPLEMAKVFQAIYDERYLGAKRSAQLKSQLAETIFQDEIPRYTKHKVMHKIGQLDDILCDVGVIDDGREPVLISFYTKTAAPESYASDFIAATTGKIYNFLRDSQVSQKNSTAARQRSRIITRDDL